LRAVHGQPLDPDAVERLTGDASETELRARLVTLATQAHAVKRKADEVGVPDGRGPNGEGAVQQVADLIWQKVDGPAGGGGGGAVEDDRSGGGWHEQLDVAARYSGPRKGMSGDQTVVAQRRAAIKRVSDQLATFAKDLNIGEYLKWSYEQIADQQLRTMI